MDETKNHEAAPAVDPSTTTTDSSASVLVEAAPRSRSESLKAYWADPANRERHAQKMRTNWATSAANVALAQKRSVRIRDNNGVEYDSVNDAARKLRLHASNIRAHLRGRVKHVRGFTFTVISRPEGH